MASRKKWGRPDDPRQLMACGGAGAEGGGGADGSASRNSAMQQHSRGGGNKARVGGYARRQKPQAVSRGGGVADPKQLEYIRKLERKNRLKRLEQETAQANNKQAHLEKGFNMHWSGANQEARSNSRDGPRSRDGARSRDGPRRYLA
jgi:hypothetical protein